MKKLVAIVACYCLLMTLLVPLSNAQKTNINQQKKEAAPRVTAGTETPIVSHDEAINSKQAGERQSSLTPPAGVVAAGKPLFTQGGKEDLDRAKLISLDILSQQVQMRSVGAINDLKVEKVEIDDSQMAHTRVRQIVEGIPVWEGEAIVHLKSDGSLFTITDDLKEGIRVDTKPSISADDAVRIAINLYTGTAVETEAAKVGLWVYRGEDRDHLTYRVEIPRLDGSQSTAIPVDFIDAQTGQRVFGYDNLQTGTGTSLYSGTVPISTSGSGQNFFMEDLTRRMGTFNMNNTGDPQAGDPGTQSPYVDGDDNWTASIQRAGVDAHYGAAKTFDYYLNVHGRNGIDGSGGPRTTLASANGSTSLITSRVHFGSAYKNAFWNGSVMTYGDGDGFQFSPLTTLDICGHEMTHGVTQYTANLVYAGESGALNESMSDVFGTMIERFARPSTWNWKIGEDAFTPGTSGDALRYMDNPRLDGHSPDHYSQRLYPGFCSPDEFNDRCGVHTNSSIANHAFYLIAAGGTNRVSGITVPGIGPDDAAKIWYRALTSYMTSSTTFIGARTATLNAATAIFGGSSTQYNAVATGWCAVGVGTCPGSSGTCVPASISAGQTINGSLSTSDCIFTGTTKYVDVYSFNGTAGQNIVVTMNSSSFDTFLYLVNSSNQVISEDDDGGDSTNSRIPSESGTFSLPATGTYSIWATSYSADLVGPYSLTLTVSGGGGCSAAPIAIGQTVSGSLATSDCFYTGTSRYVDLYTFSGNAGQQIAITMNSSATDTYLYLVNTSNQILSQDDDAGEGLNSRIPGASGYFSLPATGTYTIHATTYEYATPNTGAYSLSVIQGSSHNRKTAGVFRPTNGIIYLRNSNTGGVADINLVYGNAGDQPIAGDWNGDHIDSLGIYRNGVFYLRNSNTTGPADMVFSFGAPSDQPVAGDWNGDGITTIGVYRPSTGVFYLRNSNSAGGADISFVLGNPGDIGIAGDWNGDGVTTTGVFRPSNGIIYLKNTNVSGFADIYLVYGNAGDKPLAGDWDGDGVDSVGIYRNGLFYLRNSNTQGFADLVFALGNNGDVPVAGDWNGLP
jgi:thermolysin